MNPSTAAVDRIALLSGDATLGTGASRARLAASLIVIDRSAEPVRVLMGRRHPGLAFMGGKFVFPGGRLEASDRSARAVRELPSAVAEKIAGRRSRPSASLARGLALAAIRETFEETGYAVGARVEDAARGPTARAESGSWSRFHAAGALPDLHGLRFIARAVTPPGRSRRFDTAFFCVDVAHVCARAPEPIGPDAEFVELVWTPLDAADDLDLAAITRVILRDLADRLAIGLEADEPAPFYRSVRGRWRREEI